jgi:putative ABC transport system permease protein
VEALPETLIAVALLAGITIAVLASYGVPERFSPALAILRGALQLAAVSLVLSGVITSPIWVAVALLVMFTVAVVTAARRLGLTLRAVALCAAAMGGGAVVALTVVFSTGAVELTPRYALALGGIVIGNTMTVATLAGRRFREAVVDHWAEVEGWLALGATPRQSTGALARLAVHSSLIPSTDQTKTTGLVTLPGAFVGAIFGGLSPLEAGRFQIVVLASIMAAGSLTALVIVSALAPVRTRPIT